MSPIAAAVGFYGKLPCRGDFLRRRVSQEFMDVWDEWLQRALAHSRQSLQEAWLDAYLTSPVWRFALAEGVCGTGAYAGVMVPSVDRVGRYFPLTIVAQWNAGESPLHAACGAHRWFDAAEALAMEAPDTSDLAAFDERVAQLAEKVDASGVGESAGLQQLMKQAEFPHRVGQWHVPLVTVHSMQRAVTAIAVRELERTLRPLSIWWTDGSDRIPAAWLTVRGLPAAESFAAMLTGEWTTTGWNSVGPGSPVATRPSEPSLRAPAQSESSQASALKSELSMVFELEAYRPTPLELTAYHEPISRKWNAPPQSVYFVSRPDVGLWGVSASGTEDARHAAAQAISDVLQSVPPSGTLSSLVESVRRNLVAARRQLAKGPGAGGAEDPYALSRGIIYLARDNECAIVSFGDVQAVRRRGSNLEWIIGIADFLEAPPPAPAAREPAGSVMAGSLMDIVTGANEPAFSVRYESLLPGDQWLIAAAPLFDQPQRSLLDSAIATFELDAGSALAAVKQACSKEYSKWEESLPLLCLIASPLPVEA